MATNKNQNKMVNTYVKKYCMFEEDGSIVSKTTNSYITHITNDNLLRFLAEHNINEVYGYRDFRKMNKSKVACCGFSEKEQKWYGWTHRGIRCFGIGDTYYNYLGGKPAKTLEECKKLAFYAVQELD